MKQFCQDWFAHLARCLFIYTIVYFVSDGLASRGVPYADETNFIRAGIIKQARIASRDLFDRPLALNFLANQKFLNGDADIYRASGTAHLLAISGGQLAPMARLVTAVLCFLPAIILRVTVSPMTTAGAIRRLRSVVNFSFCSLACLGLGNTGALIRTSYLNSFSKLPILDSVTSYLGRRLYFVFEGTLRRMVVLSTIIALFGNPFSNVSFLLSALGASVASLVGTSVGTRCKDLHVIERYFVTLGLTSIAVTLILSGFHPAFLFTSLCANILCVPLVTFIITPLALLLLVFPTSSLLASSFEYALHLFKYCSMQFHYAEAPVPNFGNEFNVYLCFWLFLLWSIIDCRQSLTIVRLRRLVSLGKTTASPEAALRSE